MTKKFKRYFTGHDNGKSGKGDWQREAQISDQEISKNWCRTFGHKRLVTPELCYGTWRCLDCGMTGQVPIPK
jgi:hypothetical protein